MKDRKCPVCQGHGLVVMSSDLAEAFPDVLLQNGYSVRIDDSRELVVLCPCCDGWTFLRDGSKSKNREIVN